MNLKKFNSIKTLFFDNLTIKQTVFKNSFWLMAGLGINRLLKLILFIYAARILGATEYGKFNFAFAFISLFTIFSDFGLSTIITREFSREERKEEFHSIISLKILLSLGTLILVFLGSFFITQEPDIRKIILILIFFNLVNGILSIFYAIFYAKQRMEYQAWGEILQNVLATGFGILVLSKIPSVENLSYTFLFSSLVGLIFIWIFFHLKIFPVRISWQKSVWQKFLILSWPVALISLFDSLYNYTDSVMMGHWGMITETGWYNAAFRITWTIFLFAGFTCAGFFPILSKSFKESKEEFQRIWNYQMEFMVIIAFPLMIGGITLASGIINLVYGAVFTPSILAFQILIVMTGILLLYSPFYQVLIASDQQKRVFWVILGGAIANIILNSILIPKYTLYGAAVATVISHLLVFFLMFIFTLRFTSIRMPYKNLLTIFSKVIFSTILMFLVISRLNATSLSVFLSIIIGAITYFSIFFILKTMQKRFGYIKEKIST